MNIYKISDNNVRQVFCATSAYGTKDEDGDIIGPHTHFRIEVNAWENLLAQTDHDAKRCVFTVTMCKEELAFAKEDLVCAALDRQIAWDNYAKWKKENDDR